MTLGAAASAALCWVIVAVTVAVSERRWSNAAPAPDATLAALASDHLLQIATVIAFGVPPLMVVGGAAPPEWPMMLAGLGLGLGGAVLRARSMQTLGRRYRLTPLQQPDVGGLVVAGPYRVVRHPGYLGLVSAFAGLSILAAGSWGLVAMAPLVAGVIWRMSLEEELLAEEFPADLPTYRRQVPWRLIPHLY